MPDRATARQQGNTALSSEQRQATLQALRNARLELQRDAEAFPQLLFAVERLGMMLTCRLGQLNDYRSAVSGLAASSCLADELPRQWRTFFSPFSARYASVQYARNDALHHGAFARHLSASCIQLALVLEDAVASQPEPMKTVADFMTRDPVRAELWQPVAHVRQLMLSSSFSFLPIEISAGEWKLLSDAALACFLRSTPEERSRRMGSSVRDALAASKCPLQPEPDVPCVSPSDLIDDVVQLMRNANRPVLVTEVADERTRLVGIITAFDCL